LSLSLSLRMRWTVPLMSVESVAATWKAGRIADRYSDCYSLHGKFWCLF
jgi:hypothetical protein